MTSSRIDVDAIIDSIASRQHGIVARWQLVAAGVATHRIETRVTSGRLRPVYRGVYRVGPIAGVYWREMAAVLACGEGAVASRRSAAILDGLAPDVRPGGPVHVTVRGRWPVPGKGVIVHRTLTLSADDVTVRHGVPVTSTIRTILDLAAGEDLHTTERAIAIATRRGSLDVKEILERLRREPRRRGGPALRAILGDGRSPPFTRSEAEERFIRLVRRGQLPAPEINAVLHGYEVDCLWRKERVVVEIDGHAFHAAPDAFERDRLRDASLSAKGFRVMRVTWRQLTRTPEAVLTAVAQALVSGTGRRDG